MALKVILHEISSDHQKALAVPSPAIVDKMYVISLCEYRRTACLIPELEKALGQRLGLGVRESHLLAMNFVDVIKQMVIEGNSVVIQGFGTFSIKDVPQKTRPVFGKLQEMPEHKKVVFKASPAWSREVNENAE